MADFSSSASLQKFARLIKITINKKILKWKQWKSFSQVNVKWSLVMIKEYMLGIGLCLTTACQPYATSSNNSLTSQAMSTQADRATEAPFGHANNIQIHEVHPIKGSEKVSVHSYTYVRSSDYCARTIALNLISSYPYEATYIALRNRAYVTGADALAITGWHEHNGLTSLTAHFFDCKSKRGLTK